MVSKKIILSAISDAHEFTSIISKCPVDADLVNGRYKVDAKSIMGLFSLNLSNPLTLMFHTDNEADIKDVLEELDKFILN